MLSSGQKLGPYEIRDVVGAGGMGTIGYMSPEQVRGRTGTVQAICDAAIGRGGTWNHENVILFAPSWNTALFRVSAWW